MTHRKNTTNSENLHQKNQKTIRRERIIWKHKIFFDETLNGLFEDENLILREKYLDALKYLCMREAEKGLRKLRMGSILF